MQQRVIAGLGLSALIGSVARWRGMLTTGGVVGSMLIGTIVFSVGGLARSVVVVALFASSATADTWTTEVGTLARRQPRLITTGKSVPPGTSGGVTWLGTSAAVAGGLLLGLTAALTARGLSQEGTSSGMGLAAAGLSGGLSGVLVDSLLGATVQQVYFCPRYE